MRHLAPVLVLWIIGAQHAQAQHASRTTSPHEASAAAAALPHDLDPIRGPRWGPGGPWADEKPYAPPPKPPGWVDPEPSRWPWTGDRDPYGDAGRGGLRALSRFGAGAQIAVVQGSPDEAGPFVARVMFAANATVPAHSHSAIVHMQVLSGVVNIGAGDELDTSKTRALGPGSVTTIQPGTNHFAWFRDETVIQLNGIGPWTVTYVDPANDPTKSPIAAAMPP